MRNRILLILMLGIMLVLCSGIVSATLITQNASMYTVSGSAQIGKTCVRFTPLSNNTQSVYLEGAWLGNVSNTDTRMLLYNSSKTHISNTTITSLYANFSNQSVLLTIGDNYYICSWKDGASRNHFSRASAGYPIVNSVINWTAGSFDLEADESGNWYSLGAIIVKTVMSTITISSVIPVNGTNSTDQLSAGFTFTSTDASAGNCSLRVNGALNASLNGITSGSSVVLNASGMTQGYYNWSVDCVTASIALTTTGNYSYYADTTAPSCNFGSSYDVVNLASGYDFNVTCTDEHFYSLNVSCTSGWNFSIDGLDVSVYNFTENYATNSSFTTDTCSYEYCDGHTDNDISDVEFIIKPIDEDGKPEIDLVKNAIPIGSFKAGTPGAVITPVKLADRISFQVDLKNTIGKSHTFYYTVPEGSVHLPSDVYTGWIVSYTARSWFDMNSAQVKKGDVKVKKVNGTTWEFTVTSAEKLLVFESIGSLNCVLGSFTMTSVWTDYGLFTPFSCPLTGGDLSDTLGFLGMMFMFMLMIFISVTVLRYPVIDVFLALIVMIFSVTMWSCGQWYTYFMFLFGLGYAVSSLFRIGSN